MLQKLAEFVVAFYLPLLNSRKRNEFAHGTCKQNIRALLDP